MPNRYRRSNARGLTVPEGAVSVSHPSRYSNPWKPGGIYIDRTGDGKVITPITEANALAMFKAHADAMLAEDPDWLAPLRGKNLGCFCALDSETCHADYLLKLLAERYPED